MTTAALNAAHLDPVQEPLDVDETGADAVTGWLAAAGQALSRAGVEGPRREARLIAAHVLNRPAADLIAPPQGPGEDRIGAGERERLDAALHRRLEGMPLGRILGEREFWSLTFRLSPETLEPRPDSETLIEALLARLGRHRASVERVIDVGTGTGCLLLAALSELPGARGLGTDCAAGAVRTAWANAARLGLKNRTRFVVGDLLTGVAPGRADVVLSNPPYVGEDEFAALPAAVRVFDPPGALLAGADGLACYRPLVAQAGQTLTSDGLLVLETSDFRAPRVAEILEGHGFTAIEPHRDLAGQVRCLTARGRRKF